MDRLWRLTVEKEEKREEQTRRQECRTLKKEAVRCQGSTVNADRLLDSWRAYIMAKVPAPTLPALPARRVVCFNTDGQAAASGSISPAQHRGFLRKTSGTGDHQAAEEFQEVSILVDSGSQQEPMCATALAQRLGLQGTFSSYAVQAGGQPLPIYEAGWCDLGLNGKPCRTRFKSAVLDPFDIILGESWLREHRGVLDYADNRLWQKVLDGQLSLMSFDLPRIPMPPPNISTESVLPKWLATWNGASTVETEGGQKEKEDFTTQTRHTHTFWGECEYEDWNGGMHLKDFKLYLQAVLDFDKELPEDGELDLSDIPGTAPVTRTSFSFVDEVRVHLAHLPAAQIDEVVQRLQAFEGDVFETRTQPRPPPTREFDVPIVEKQGMEPPARRPYPVARHHQPELDQQIEHFWRMVSSDAVFRHTRRQCCLPQRRMAQCAW